jgi:phosphomannomutase
MDVMRIGMGPSPMLYFSTYALETDGGIQVTGATIRPITTASRCCSRAARCSARRSRRSAAAARPGDWCSGSGDVDKPGINIVTAYVDRLLKDFQGGTFRIGWDAGNGAAGRVLEELVKRLPGEHHTIFTEVDGTFPNHHPDPTVEANLADLKRLVTEKNLDFGIAFDGDGDRIGAVDGKGRVIWGDQLLMILAGRCCKSSRAPPSSPTSRRARCCSTASRRWAAGR